MRIGPVLCLVLALLLPVWSDVDVPIGNHWAGGFEGEACFTISQALTSWTVTLNFDVSIKSIDVWKGQLTSSSSDGKSFTFKNQQYNGNLRAGEELCLPFQAHGDGDITPKVTASIAEEPNGGTFSPVTRPPPVTAAPGETLPPTTPYTINIPSEGGIVAPMNFIQELGDTRFEATFSVPLTEDVNGWVFNLSFALPVTDINQDLGDVIYTSPDNKVWTLVNKPHENKSVFKSGTKWEIRFVASYTGGPPHPEGAAVFYNMGFDTWSVDPNPQKDDCKYNYDDVLYKSILFYEAQRSGKLPPTNRIPWRGDSALDDKGDKGEDLTGGWYDAGDHVKFNFPMAYTVTALAWGYLYFKDAYEDAGQTDEFMDCIKWPLDYLLKCHTGPTELYVQVGDAGTDHAYWGAPEAMTMNRPAYKIDASKPGSDIAMETAAAFAASYLVFKDSDSTYANTLLDHAKELWEFGKQHPGKYTDSVPAAAGYYLSNNYTDETCWGSNWLYKATGEQKYLDEAELQFDPDPAWGESWDEKTIGNQILLYEATKKDNYKTAVENSIKGWMPGGDVPYTPKGLGFRLMWGSLRYASNMAMAALVAAELGINPDAFRAWAMSQIHYALGDTGFSYVIGFGDNYPHSPHHRSSSCPNTPAPCGSAVMNSKEPNVHILYGAMVGGPGESDDYEDDRTNYVNNEVACDYNAGMQGAVAGLKHLRLIGEHPDQV